MDPFTTLTGALISQLVGTAWKGTIARFNKTDIEKAINKGKKTIKERERELSPEERLLASHSTIVNKVFQNSGVLEQLQKPWIDKGKPDVKFIVEVFKEQINNSLVNLNESTIEPWVEEFVNAYFQHTNTYINFQIAKDQYFQQLLINFNDVKFAGFDLSDREADKPEKLDRIFVMPDIAEDILTRPEQVVLESRDRTKFSASQLLSQTPVQKVVILGAPGSGKTSLMKYFTVRLAQQKPQELELNADIDWLPILIGIRDWATHPEMNILDFARYFAEKRMMVSELPTGFFEHWLDGRAVILLDGLDEVGEQGYDFVKQIENFLGRYPRNKAIVTSRPAGYKRDFFRTEEFPHYQLLPFDKPKIYLFVEQWHQNRFPDREEAEYWEKSLKSVLEESDRLMFLAKTPLLLTLIALLHRYDTYHLPQKRSELYSKAVETLIKTWEQKKSDRLPKLEHLGWNDLKRLMERLAYWVQTRGETSQEGNKLMKRGELIDRLKEDIQIYGRPVGQIQKYQAEEEAKRFLSHIRERTGLLNEQGQNSYAFVHPTFQEYLCAREINYRRDEDGFDVVEEHIQQYLYDPDWREVLLLLITELRPKQAAKAIGVILKQTTDDEDLRYHNLLFAGLCLTEDPEYLHTAPERSFPRSSGEVNRARSE